MASALWLGVRSIVRRTLKRDRMFHLNLGLQLAFIAIGTFGAIWLTGLLLGLAVPVPVVARQYINGAGVKSASTVLFDRNVVRWYMLGFAVITLFLVMAGVEVLRLVVARSYRKRPVRGASIS